MTTTTKASAAKLVSSSAAAVSSSGATQSPFMQLGRITQWMEFKARHSSPACASFCLAHLTEKGDAIVETLPLPKTSAEDLATTIADIARALYEQAMQDACTHARVQRYGIVAYAKADAMLGRTTFLCAPPLDHQLSGETEPATATGQVAQNMRLTDATMRLALTHAQQAYDRMLDENESLRAQIAAMHQREDLVNQRRMEMFDKIEALETKKLERDLLVERERKSQARVERVYAQLETLVPLLTEKWGFPIPGLGAGKASAPPLDPSVDPSDAFAHFFVGLSAEQKAGIMKCLTEEQTSQLVAILQALVTRRAEKEKATS